LTFDSAFLLALAFLSFGGSPTLTHFSILDFP
jgi:hypothetical protein